MFEQIAESSARLDAWVREFIKEFEVSIRNLQAGIAEEVVTFQQKVGEQIGQLHQSVSEEMSRLQTQLAQDIADFQVPDLDVFFSGFTSPNSWKTSWGKYAATDTTSVVELVGVEENDISSETIIVDKV